jgi:hypothetical protein
VLALAGVLMAARAERACANEFLTQNIPVDAEAGARPRRIVREPSEELELEMSLEFASAYVFRGYNVFQAEEQREQKWVQRPLVVWNAPGTGFSLGYAGAYQLSGGNLVSNVAVGLGAEQDLFASYELGHGERWGLTSEIVGVAYPAADKRDAGTSTPFFVTMSLEPRYRHRLFFYVGYLQGFRHGPLDRDQLYLNPRVEKRFAFGERFELALQLGAGMKILSTDLGVVRDNMFDVLATATLYYALNDEIYVGSKIGWAWTNLTAGHDPLTGEAFHPGFGDEYVPFFALIVGAEFAAPSRAGADTRRRGGRGM